jgi:hypothetical protein
MTAIEIAGDQLVIRVLGLDVLASFKREIRVSLQDIDGVASATSEMARPPGLRTLGLSVPGFQAGTFFGADGKAFWNVHGIGSQAIVVYLRGDGPYQKIVVDVEDPDEAIRTILRAAATPR